MTHVKVVNKKTGVPQVLTKANYRNIKEQMPSLSMHLEYLNDCNEFGLSENEAAEEEKRKAHTANPERSTSQDEEMKKIKEQLAKAEAEKKELEKQVKSKKDGKKEDSGN